MKKEKKVTRNEYIRERKERKMKNKRKMLNKKEISINKKKMKKFLRVYKKISIYQFPYHFHSGIIFSNKKSKFCRKSLNSKIYQKKNRNTFLH